VFVSFFQRSEFTKLLGDDSTLSIDDLDHLVASVIEYHLLLSVRFHHNFLIDRSEFLFRFRIELNLIEEDVVRNTAISLRIDGVVEVLCLVIIEIVAHTTETILHIPKGHISDSSSQVFVIIES